MSPNQHWKNHTHSQPIWMKLSWGHAVRCPNQFLIVLWRSFQQFGGVRVCTSDRHEQIVNDSIIVRVLRLPYKLRYVKHAVTLKEPSRIAKIQMYSMACGFSFFVVVFFFNCCQDNLTDKLVLTLLIYKFNWMLFWSLYGPPYHTLRITLLLVTIACPYCTFNLAVEALTSN